MRNEKGFTLIELMLVVSIIGILAAIAIPQFSTYRQRAHGAEGYTLGSEVQKNIIEFYSHTGRFPADNAEAGLPNPSQIKGNYVESITIHNGAFDVKFGEKYSKYEIITARPAVVKNNLMLSLFWVWGDSKAPDGMELVGENHTKPRPN